MKKLLAASVLALALVAGSQQQASAWSHFKFGIGMNIDWSCGDNNLLWGVYRCGPTPQDCGSPLGGLYAPSAAPGYAQPGYSAPASSPAQYRGAPAGTQLAGYPANYNYQGNSYYPANNNQGASYYPMSYYPGANYYYPMSYHYGYPQGISFYGN